MQKRTIIAENTRGWCLCLSLFLLQAFFITPGVLAENRESEIQEEVLDEIDLALREAESEMVSQDEAIERARQHLSLLEEPEVDILPPRASQSVVYQDQGMPIDEMSSDFEFVTESVRLRSKTDVSPEQRELDRHMATSSEPYERAYIPSDGILAYKVAVSDGLITLNEAIDIGLKASAQLQSLKMRAKGAERKLMEARRAFFPTISAEVFSSGGIVSGTAYTGESWQLKFQQTLWDGGELLFTLRQAEANLKSDQAKYNQDRMELIHAVGEAYHNLVENDYNLSYQEALSSEVSAIHERVEKEYELKLISEVDYLEVNSIHNQTMFQAETAISSLESATLSLQQQLGVGPKEIPIDKSLNYTEVPVELETVRTMIQSNNWSIKAKALAAKASFYALRMFDAKKHPKIELVGNVGLTGEGTRGAGFTNDLEDEHGIELRGSMPLGGSTVDYRYNRRFFAPTLSSFLGSEDWKHKVRFFLLDNLADLTDKDVARADYLLALADLKKEKMDKDIAGQEAYYNYKGALLQMNTSLVRVKFREKQVNILRLVTGMGEQPITELLNEMVQLSDDRFEYVKAVGDIHDAISDLNRLIGIDKYYGHETRDT